MLVQAVICRVACSPDVVVVCNRLNRHSASNFEDRPFKDETQTALFKDPVRCAVNTFHLGYKDQSVYDVSGTSRCLFSDKYNVGRAYNC